MEITKSGASNVKSIVRQLISRNSERTKGGAMEKLTKIINFLKILMDRKFTGSIKIKFTRGTVERVEQFEEILKNK